MPCLTPFYVTKNGLPSKPLPDGSPARIGSEQVPVPCGRCPDCKHRRVAQWAYRLMKENERSFSSHFVTLTYSTETVPLTGSNYMTLSKTDLQKFIKRLRKKQAGNKASQIKYYAAGEYSPSKQRPHYHLIIFNVTDPKFFDQCWTHGRISVDPVNTKSVAYTCKYLHKTGKSFKHNDDRENEFSLMSKRLGDNYLTPQQITYHKNNLTERNFVQHIDGYKIPMPRYYADKIYTRSERTELMKHASRTISEQDKTDREKFIEIYAKDSCKARDYHLYLEDKRRNAFRSFDNITKKRDL